MEGGRWGLVIVASAFLIQVFAFGVSTSIGIYNIEFLDYFDNDTVGVSLISAINWALFLGSGPLASYLMTKMSYRKIALLGSVMVAVGFFLMPFLPYIPALCISFGVLAGVGSCLVYIPSHVLSGLYYERHQSLSTGIATSGSGLGGTIMPIILGKLIDHYGWKGSLIIVAGMQLHLIVFAALLRAPPQKVEKKSSDTLALLEQKSSDKKRDSMPNDKKIFDDEENIPRAILAVSEDLGELSVGDEVEESDVNSSGTPADLNGTNHSHSVDHIERPVITIKNHCETSQTKNNPDACSVEKSGASPDDVEEANAKVLHHIYLFTDAGFNVYFISSILWNTTAASILSFGPELIADRGMSPMNSAWLLTILGLGNFVGGILGGVIGNVWVHRRTAQYVTANIGMGVCIFAFPFGSTFGEYAAIMVCIGLTFGVVLGLLVVVLIDLIGTDNLGDGLGYIMLANGIGALAGPAFTGYIRKVAGSYNLAFYLAGACGVLAGAIMWLIPVLKHLLHQTNIRKPKSSVIESGVVP